MNGPKLGYFPKAVKTVLILKDKSLLLAAKLLFGDTGIEISCDGERHLGAVIGSKEARETYVKKKVEKWVKDVEELSEIGLDEPQAALLGFTKALCHESSVDLCDAYHSGHQRSLHPVGEVYKRKVYTGNHW